MFVHRPPLIKVARDKRSCDSCSRLTPALDAYTLAAPAMSVDSVLVAPAYEKSLHQPSLLSCQLLALDATPSKHPRSVG